MQITKTIINDLSVVRFDYQVDLRGSFSRLFCADKLQSILGDHKILQINRSVTKKVGSIRGLHFQYPPNAEMKLVRCLTGKIWDVAVDLRLNSSTYMKWFAVELSSVNSKMMIIPEGFAHGFQVLEPNSELLYLHTAYYNPKSEGGIRYDDPALDIAWPLPVSDISVRDRSYIHLETSFKGIVI
jgi:dTDP-4-dehydrorhamnose 3,5-epimerase